MGLSQFDFLQQAHQYGRVLAQGTPRKLALLIGINDYASPVSSLQGCLTDVELQRELLVHRFGFVPDDIEILINQDATRANILQTFEEHLIKQAKPGDVVVFHYSGHGSLVSDPNPLDTPDCRAAGNCEVNGTLVLADPLTSDATGDPLLPHIMGRTMFFLRNAVQTQNLTLVLDSCYAGAGTRGNVMVRSVSSRLSTEEIQLAPQVELDYQQRWLTQTGLSLEDFQQRRRENRVNGVAIGSASRNQEALDVPFGDFYAGAFTYLMTRYLWQLSRDESFGTVRTNLVRSTQALADGKRKTQVPVFEAPDLSAEQQPVYFLPTSSASAEAAVTNVDGGQIEFWLGGVSSQNLQSNKTVFVLLNSAGEPVTDEQGKPIEIQQENRIAPLYGYGSLKNGQISAVKPGMLLREKIVGLPTNPTLAIGLDGSLEGEVETARTALGQALLSKQNVSRIRVVEQRSNMDYLFGRMTEAYRQELADRGATELPPVGSLGLFNSDRSEVVSGSFGRAGEPTSAAVNRLQPKLKLLLVSQVLRAITSTNSDLQVAGEIFTSNARVPLINARNQAAMQVNTMATRQFRTGEEIQFKVENQENQEVYLSCIAIDAQGALIVLHPYNWDAPEESARIDRQSSLTVPQAPTVFQVSGAGFIELLTLVSTSPLSSTLKGLGTISRGRGNSRGFVNTRDDEALDVVGDLLGDLDNITRSGDATIVTTTRDEQVRDTNTLAAFSTVVEIVE
jgi:hypothetical protein